MSILIPIVLIVGLAILFKTGWHPKHWGWTGGVALAIILLWWVFSSPKKEKGNTPTPVAQTPPAPVQTTEALMRRFKGKTPCSTKIEWPFQIWTDGRPVSVKFNGRRDWVPFPGEGEFNAPKMWYGDTQFKSPDTNHPIIDVWVYEVVTVRK